MCPNKHSFRFSVSCENPTLRRRRLAILPSSGSYDPELPSATRQLIIYLSFLPPFPLCSHALYASVTHSSHLHSNFLFLYLLVRPALVPLLDYISLVWIDVRSRHLSDPPIRAGVQYASSSHMPRVLQVVLSCFS